MCMHHDSTGHPNRFFFCFRDNAESVKTIHMVRSLQPDAFIVVGLNMKIGLLLPVLRQKEIKLMTLFGLLNSLTELKSLK